MRGVFLYLVIFTMVALWSAGCFYTVDRSLICEDGEVTEEGYGLACVTDEDCAGNPTQGDAGATQCSTLDKLVVIEIPDVDMDASVDGGMPPAAEPPGDMPEETGDAGSALDDLLESLEPALNICTDMACMPGGCPACYQCCECDISVSDAMEMFGVAPDPTLDNAKLDFAACLPASVGEILAMICTCS
jgi:hypothetical protein